MKFEVFMAVKV